MISLILALALQTSTLGDQVAGLDVQQRLREEEASARISDLHMASAPQVRPFATVSALGSWREPNEVLSLFSYRPNPDGPVTVAVRRKDMTSGAETVASSQRCRGLKEAVTALERVNMPEIDVPLLGDHETGSINPTVKDGVTYTLWMPFPGLSDERIVYDLQLRFTSDSSFERWYQGLTEAAAPCWGPAPAQ